MKLRRHRGTDPTYLAQKIARDRPDIAERLARGEFRSVRQAAIEAGVIRIPTPIEVAQKAFGKLTTEERSEFVAWMEGNDNGGTES